MSSAETAFAALMRQREERIHTVVRQYLKRIDPQMENGRINLANPRNLGTVPPTLGGTGTPNGAEPPLGNPAANGSSLSSTTAGARSWVEPFGAALERFGVVFTNDGTVVLRGDGTLATKRY